MNDSSLLEIIDNPQHSTKKELRPVGFTPKKRPPKLTGKRSFNRALFSNAPTMILQDENSPKDLNRLYDDSLEISYYDQCYEQVRLIGAGSYGEVYKVRSKETGKFYALKRTQEAFRSSADRLAKIAEVRKYERMSAHENIVALVHAWSQDDYVYVVMELGSCSLQRYAQNNPDFPEIHLWNILLDILLALNFMHEQNYIHLDVKLDNIIIFDNGTCKLADFDLTIHLKDEIQFATEGDGTYAPSELMRGRYTKAADVFSLGISMLELASDMVLPTNGKLWHDLRDGKFPIHIVDCIPKELFNVIKRMMIKEYKKRPSVKTLLRHPRLKSLKKQRRLAQQQKSFESPTLRCSTPLISTPLSTPPRDVTNRCPSVSVTTATPPLGHSVPDISFLLNSFEKSMNKSLDPQDAPAKRPFYTPEVAAADGEALPRAQNQRTLGSSAKKLFSQ